MSDAADDAPVHRRRPRYAGKYPRKFAEKYKEHAPDQYPEVAAKVVASGKTVAGTHRPIMVAEILQALAPQPGEVAVDCTLGYGGHTQEILPLLQPRGRLIGLDADPAELPRTEARLRGLGFCPDVLSVHRSNFAGLPKVLKTEGLPTVDIILADLGVSSMQLDNPARGFSVKVDGPLDMRMNPQHGMPASELIRRISPEELAEILRENSDEPHADLLAFALSGHEFATTLALANAIRRHLPDHTSDDDVDLSVRRVFQALRIAVNDEFGALDTLLRLLPYCLKPGGRVAILTFHSGEDRRVKKAFAAGERDGLYRAVAREVIRPSAAERHANPRSTPAKLRWAIRGR